MAYTWVIYGLIRLCTHGLYICIYGFYIGYRWFIDDLYGLYMAYTFIDGLYRWFI